MKKKSIKTHYGIHKNTSIEFFDVPIDGDIEAFICPFLIANNRDKRIADSIFHQLTIFLTKLNRSYVQTNDRINGLKFLSHLHEPNEYHLGYSETNRGKAISTPRSETIFDALRKNQFSRQGLSITNEAHNVLLLVNGIGQDIMSDFIANVCRNIFAVFTETICKKHKIPTVLTEVEFFDTSSQQWVKKKFNLPSYLSKSIIFVPSFLISGGRPYHICYNRFIARNYLSYELMNREELLKAEEKMIVKLKDGTKRAIIKEILKVYGKPKHDLINFVLKYKGSLDEFLKYAKEHYPELNLDNFE